MIFIIRKQEPVQAKLEAANHRQIYGSLRSKEKWNQLLRYMPEPWFLIQLMEKVFSNKILKAGLPSIKHRLRHRRWQTLNLISSSTLGPRLGSFPPDIRSLDKGWHHWQWVFINHLQVPLLSEEEVISCCNWGWEQARESLTHLPFLNPMSTKIMLSSQYIFKYSNESRVFIEHLKPRIPSKIVCKSTAVVRNHITVKPCATKKWRSKEVKCLSNGKGKEMGCWVSGVWTEM
jgi:hypothetical protein